MTSTEKQDLFCGLRIVGIAALTTAAAAILYAGPQPWNNYTNPVDALDRATTQVMTNATGSGNYWF